MKRLLVITLSICMIFTSSLFVYAGESSNNSSVFRVDLDVSEDEQSQRIMCDSQKKIEK